MAMEDGIIAVLAVAAVPGAIAGIFGATAARRRGLGRRLRRAVPVTCRELAAMTRAPALVVVTGRVQPGPTGQLTGPVTGGPCLWWRVDETHAYQQEGRTYTSDAVTHRAEATVELRDDTGSVLLDGRVFDRFIAVYDIDNPTGFRVATHDFVEGRRGGRRALLARLRDLGICDFTGDPPATFTFHEMRVEQHRKVTVLGAPVRHGHGWWLTAQRGGGSSVEDLATLCADADREAAGLSRFARSFALCSGALLAIAGVAQVVMLR
jgi:hypothetical protein